MKLSILQASTVLLAGLGALAPAAHAASFSEGFNSGTMASLGWTTVNRSTQPSAAGVWRLGTAITDSASNPVVLPYEGSAFAVVSWNSSTSSSATAATLSNWLISPLITGLNNGDTFSFYTTTTPGFAYADRMEVRLSTAGSSTNVGTTATSVGDFSTLMLTINSALSVPGYPEEWTFYQLTVSGLSAPVDGRVAFRYFVTQGGPNGLNSNIIGLDQFSYVSAVPEPGTWALMLGGVAGLMAWRRRQAA